VTCRIVVAGSSCGAGVGVGKIGEGTLGCGAGGVGDNDVGICSGMGVTYRSWEVEKAG
jgi:hypothetical protein